MLLLENFFISRIASEIKNIFLLLKLFKEKEKQEGISF